MTWTHHLGSAKLISFAVTASDDHNYTLEFDTQELTWSLSIVETHLSCRSPSPEKQGRYRRGFSRTKWEKPRELPTQALIVGKYLIH